MSLLIVGILSVGQPVRAGTPGVQAPIGPQSGSVFTGTFTFNTYIYCTAGYEFPSSYSSNLNGTHGFAFYGAPDGSLLLSIDGGGLILLTSCGDPFGGAATHVVTYTVTKTNGAPPTPTPTPAPTPTPTPTHTPTPTPHGGGGGSTPTPAPTATPAPGAGPTAPLPPGQTPTPAPTATPVPVGAGTPPPAATTLDPVTGKQQPAAATTPAAAPITTAPGGQASGLVSALKVAGVWMVRLFILVLVLWLLVKLARRTSLGQVAGRWLGPVWHKLWAPIWLRWLEPRLFRWRYTWHRHREALSRRLSTASHHVPRTFRSRLNLSPRHHSGQMLPHHHTSYPSLALLIIVTTVLAASMSWSSRAATTTLNLTVFGPPPSSGSTITSPADGAVTATSPISVYGTCPSGLLIEIWRDGLFAGSDFCDGSGLFSVLVTLNTGANHLVARTADALGQYGPDSSSVTVTYSPPPPTPTPTPSASPAPLTPTPQPTTRPTSSPVFPVPKPTSVPAPGPLVLDPGRHFYQTVEPGTPVDFELAVSGGTAPYRVAWDYGDGHTEQTTAAQAGPLKATHSYTAAGAYQVTVRVRDATGRTALIQLAVIVSGPTGVPTSTTHDDGLLGFVWPLLVLVALIVLSFWLGERHKLDQARQTLPLDSQRHTT